MNKKFFFDRSLFNLNARLQNKSCSEGSIVVGCLVDGCITFCSRYLQNVETKFNQSGRNEADSHGRPHGASTSTHLTDIEIEQAHRYVLFNSLPVNKFIRRVFFYKKLLILISLNI